jgi:hypothetical protein
MKVSALAIALAVAGGPLLTSCATATPTHLEATPFDPTANAAADVARARARSAASGRPLLLILGANWCHDSRALAGWLASAQGRELVAASFETAFVDVGRPQSGDGRNLAIARQFGLGTLASTPALLVIAPDGRVLNPDTAASWRNAASRSNEAIHRQIAHFASHSPPG